MTVIVSKPAVNLREELASLRNQGGYQEQQFYFDGLVTNGDFATNDLTSWSNISVGTGSANASTGAVRLQGTDSSNRGWVEQAITTVVNASYVVSINVTIDNGGVVSLSAGTSSGNASLLNAETTATGVITRTFVASTTTTYIGLRTSGVTDMTVDNVSVFETDGTDVVHRMPKDWKPKDFYEDGLLQREGSVHDYEVVYDGFYYYVKPTVAPSATTQTCVIGVKA